jgi:hypothetical protein
MVRSDHGLRRPTVCTGDNSMQDKIRHDGARLAADTPPPDYAAPEVVDLGSLAALTLGGSQPISDMTAGAS